MPVLTVAPLKSFSLWNEDKHASESCVCTTWGV